MWIYEVHTDSSWSIRCSFFEAALTSAKVASKISPRRVFRISRVDKPEREWVCSFRNGRLIESFLNAPEIGKELEA